MKCARCGTMLPDEKLTCDKCGTSYIPRCMDCGYIAGSNMEHSPDCPGKLLPVWNPSENELLSLGIRCFMPYTDDRIYDIYLGGNRNGGGYDFRSKAGYTGPSLETVVLPSMVAGMPIIGIWNNFFCIGEDFAPEIYEKTFERMYPIKNIFVSEGIREAGIHAFFGCCGLETLVLPKSTKKMMYDFLDLFPNGLNPFPNGKARGPLSICYRGSEQDWANVSVPTLLNDMVKKGYIELIFDYID